MEKLYKMEMCRFQREENGEWEVGLLFNDGSGIIIDEFGKSPEHVHDYKRGILHVSIPIDIFFNQEKNHLEYLKRENLL